MELHLHGDDLYLTRFYTQVSSVHDIHFSGELMLVAGHVELMAIQHSISQYSLKNFLFRNVWQKKYFYNLYKVTQFLPIDFGKISNTSHSHFAVVSSNKLEFVNLQKTPAGIHCEPRQPEDVGKHVVLVTINATNCGRDQRTVTPRKYCSIEHIFKFEVVTPLPYHLSLTTSFVLFSAAIAVAAICLCCITAYRRRKRLELVELRSVLKRKLDYLAHPGNR